MGVDLQIVRLLKTLPMMRFLPTGSARTIPIAFGVGAFDDAAEVFELGDGDEEDAGAFGDEGKFLAGLPVVGDAHVLGDRDLELAR